MQININSFNRFKLICFYIIYPWINIWSEVYSAEQVLASATQNSLYLQLKFCWAVVNTNSAEHASDD